MGGVTGVGDAVQRYPCGFTERKPGSAYFTERIPSGEDAEAVRGGTGQGDFRGRIQAGTASSAEEAECPALPPLSEKIPVVIAYEGWDAAGKGGNIKRIAGALDPRGYEVHPIASPEPHEKARHYLWRFWTRLPKTGHIAIFDRTWYGRVMVERLEGFCSTNDWQRAYNEINEFEKELSQWGAVIIKFWVQIDKDTQLERFTERQNTPEKQWKITDEDWRNRDKWDQYEDAVNEMLQKTSTEYAPWHILESVDKNMPGSKH